MTPAPVGLRCPEHSGKPTGIKKVTAPAQRAVTGGGSTRINAVTMALIAVNVAVFAAELALGGSLNGTGNWIFERGSLFASGAYVPGGVATLPPAATATAAAQGFHLVGVAHSEWWRLISAAFLHYGVFHLAINMYSLYFAGTLLEQIIGRWRFALLYLGAGIAGVSRRALGEPQQRHSRRIGRDLRDPRRRCSSSSDGGTFRPAARSQD